MTLPQKGHGVGSVAGLGLHSGDPKFRPRREHPVATRNSSLPLAVCPQEISRRTRPSSARLRSVNDLDHGTKLMTIGPTLRQLVPSLVLCPCFSRS